MTTPIDDLLPRTPREVLAYLDAGRAAEAAAIAQAAVNGNPTNAAWIMVLALALSANRKPAEALNQYQTLTQLQPAIATHWSNLGNCLCEIGREREAFAPLQRALLLGADDASVHFALARSYSVIGPASSALHHIDSAIAAQPDDTEFRLLRAQILASYEQWDQAHREIDRLVKMPLDDGQRVDLGYLFFSAGMYNEAIAIFQQHAVDPQLNQAYQVGLVMALERINRLDDAIVIRATIAPNFSEASQKAIDRINQMDARLAARTGDHVRASDLLQTVLTNGVSDSSLHISLLFDLGASLTKINDVDGAMAAFAQAHALRRSLVDRDHPSLRGHTGLYAILEEPVPERPLATVFTDDGHHDPIFVVGFPRSGTTLLEQLLDAHSELISFDEQPFVQRIIQRLASGGKELHSALALLDANGISDQRRAYFADIAGAVAAIDSRRPVDKNPLNMIRLPVLQEIFPRSKVILAVRHPCDVVLSCYMQSFRAPAFAVTFETIESCAEMYDKVFSYWYSALPNFHLPVHLLRYEDLVRDTEQAARDLFCFLELAWQPQLLQFTERAREKGAISTPSYSQVIEKVNTKAVGRWKAYRSYFNEAAMAHLGPWCERFEYSLKQ